MNALYAAMDALLPFEWLHYTFMKNALLAVLMIAPLFGMLGTMAVDNKMAFFFGCLGPQRAHGHCHRRGAGLAEPDGGDAAFRHSLGCAHHLCQAPFQNERGYDHQRVFLHIRGAGPCGALARRGVCAVFFRAGGGCALCHAERSAVSSDCAAVHGRPLGGAF